MPINHNTIITAITNSFQTTYQGVRMSGVVWNECMKAVSNVSLMNYIISQNNVGIPPVKTFLDSSSALHGGFLNYEKQCLGKFWGFVFKFVFMYQSQKDSNPINLKGIKTATYFYDVDVEDGIEVID